jgi:aminoglycoside phosphotransferase (APT) family kinase protein
MTRAELAARYAEKTGRDISGMVFYYVYAMFKTAVIAQQIYYRYHHGMTKDERFVAFLEATKIMMRASLRAAESGKY